MSKHAMPEDCNIDNQVEWIKRWTPDPRSVVRHGIIDPFYEGAHRHLTGVFEAWDIELPGQRPRSIWMPTNQLAKPGHEALEGCTDPTCSRCYPNAPLDFVLKRL